MYSPIELRRAALSLIMPNRCPFCDGVIGMWEYWCEECYGKLPFVEVQTKPHPPLDGMLSCCYYELAARDAVLRMKNGHYIYSIEAFAVLMTEYGAELLQKADVMTAVPTSLARRAQLGYAQAEKIAKLIAKRSGVSFRQVLGVSDVKKEQKKLNKEQRRENAYRSYKVRDEKYIFGKNILIVDDVSTTGATLSAIAELLKQAGAASVYALTFAKTR